MHFPKHWVRHTEGPATSWGCSDLDLTEARTRAEATARRIAAKLAAGESLQRYGYADRPLREEVLQEIATASGHVAAMVTRNAYGCQILNAEHALFVDVDLPEAKPAAGSLLKRLFGKPAPPSEEPLAAALARVEAWNRLNGDWGWRIYRTRAGLRLLATHALFNPASSAAEAVFAALDADPLYARLCKAQACFRARLTPKPWRCGAGNPPAGWPWQDAQRESAFRRWEGLYQKASAKHATCTLVRTCGNSQIHPEIQPIVTLHDAATRVGSTLPLA